MRKTKNIFTLLLAAVLLLCLCACGSTRTSGKSSAVSQTASFTYNDSYQEAAFAEEADYDVVYDGDAYGLSSVDASASAATGGDDGGETPTETPDKIIYSSDVTLETREFDETIGRISGLVSSFGGWIEQSSVSGSNYYQISQGNAKARDASYTLRIPSGRFSELMDTLSNLGNIPYSHIYTENVTSQYYDTQARLKAYTTQETRLLEMMELAESVEDVITIEDRLTELRYQIESLQSRLNNWDRRVSYSTIRLSVKEVLEYTPEEKIEPTYGEELAGALKEGLHNAGQFVKDLLVFVIEVLPVLVVAIPLIWLVVWLVRKIFRGSAARRASRKEEKLAKKARRTQEKADQAKEHAEKLAATHKEGAEESTKES